MNIRVRKFSVPAVLLAGCFFLAAGAFGQVMQRRIPVPQPEPAPPANEASPASASVAPATTVGVMNTEWERMGGCARRMSIAALDQIWVLDCGQDKRKEAPIRRWRNGGWDEPLITAFGIAAVSKLRTKPNTITGVSGVSGVIATGQTFYSRFIEFNFANTPASRSPPFGEFHEIATGGGWIYAIRPPEGDHTGGQIFRSNGLPPYKGFTLKPFGSLYATRVAVGLTDAIAWVIGEDGRIYRQVNQGDGWVEQPGCATSIANAGQDRVWIIGCDPPDPAGNRGIYRWDGGNWVKVPGMGKEIAVQSDNKPWVITGDGDTWRHR